MTAACAMLRPSRLAIIALRGARGRAAGPAPAIADLRAGLESTQAAHFVQIFSEAAGPARPKKSWVLTASLN